MNTLAAIADELGDLERELAPLKPKITRADALRKLLREAHRDEPAGDSFTVAGERWTVQLGPKGNESVVDTSRLAELVGIGKAYEFASITLKALETCAPDIRAAVVSTNATGTRPLHVFAAAPAPAPKEKKRARAK